MWLAGWMSHRGTLHLDRQSWSVGLRRWQNDRGEYSACREDTTSSTNYRWSLIFHLHRLDRSGMYQQGLLLPERKCVHDEALLESKMEQMAKPCLYTTLNLEARQRTVREASEELSWISHPLAYMAAQPLKEMARRGIAVAPTAHANWRRQPMGQRNYERALA